MLATVLRFIVAALVIMFVAFLLPGVRIQGFWTALLAAVAIAILGGLVEAAARRRLTPYARGLVGFGVSAVVLYGMQLVVPTVHVSAIGALGAALIIGLVDVFVPVPVR